jgi:hypothetical protein
MKSPRYSPRRTEALHLGDVPPIANLHGQRARRGKRYPMCRAAESCLANKGLRKVSANRVHRSIERAGLGERQLIGRIADSHWTKQRA